MRLSARSSQRHQAPTLRGTPTGRAAPAGTDLWRLGGLHLLFAIFLWSINLSKIQSSLSYSQHSKSRTVMGWISPELELACSYGPEEALGPAGHQGKSAATHFARLCHTPSRRPFTNPAEAPCDVSAPSQEPRNPHSCLVSRSASLVQWPNPAGYGDNHGSFASASSSHTLRSLK